MKLSWEVDGVQVVAEKLEDGLEDGMERAVNQILENLKRDAKDRIAVRPHIFTGEVYTSFDDQTTSANSSSGIKSRFINYSKHAGALEHGVHPSKYADGAPPVAALMPWVLVKLKGWDVETSGSGGGASIKTPTGGPDTSDEDLKDANEDYEADWTRFHKNGRDSAEHLWIGQDVVAYDESRGGYHGGTITEIDLYGDATITFDNGNTLRVNYLNGYDEQFNRGLIAGESWSSLTEHEQRNIAQEMFDNSVPIQNFNNDWEKKVKDSVSQYVENLRNPTHAKQMAIGLNYIEKDNSMNKKGTYRGGVNGGQIKINTDLSEVDTVRHELAHSLAMLNGYDRVLGSRHTDPNGREDWNVFDIFRKDRKLPWNYEEIGKDNWETSKGSELPHPTTYMVHNSKKRESVDTFDDVNHDAFDKWEEYVRKRAKKQATQAESDFSSPDYDPFYTEPKVLDPDGGAAREGDAMEIELSGTKYEVKIESGVYRNPESSEKYSIDISTDGSVSTIGITDDGYIADDRASFIQYAPDGAKFLEGGELTEPIDLPEDPGFVADESDPFEWFTEALNRDTWAGMTATEHATDRVRSHFYSRSDGYSHIGSHEGIAHFMAIVFDRGDGQNNAESYIVKLLNRSPELLYVAYQLTDFSPEMKVALEIETGLDFEDLMYDIWRNHIA